MCSKFDLYFTAKKLLEDFDNEVTFFLDPKLEGDFQGKYIDDLQSVIVGAANCTDKQVIALPESVVVPFWSPLCKYT